MSNALGENAEIPEVWATEIYNETDKLDWQKITAHDVLARIDVCRIFPVLPVVSLESRHDHNSTHVTLRKDGVAVRQFRITVEEVPVW